MCSCNLTFNMFTKGIRKENWIIRYYCQTVENTQTLRKYKTHTRELNAYLSSSKHLQNIKKRLPDRCLKRNRKIPDDLYLVDSVVAQHIAKLILPDIMFNKAEIVETNPGFGFITKHLLEAGIKKIHAYEPTVAFRDNMFVC